MSWRKLLKHDFIQGLLRWRYLAVFLLTLAPFLEYVSWVNVVNTPGTAMDLLFYIFKGQEKINIMELAATSSRFPIPFIWILTVGGCLFLNLDYLQSDLSITGQQILIRCGSRNRWFFSKCIWNVASTFLYFILTALSASILILCIGGKVSLSPTMPLVEGFLMADRSLSIGINESAVLAVLLPLLSLAALNLLQMTLCLFVKPIVSFLLSIGVIVLSVYIPSPILIGNAAMTIRSKMITESGVPVLWNILFTFATVLLCIIIGSVHFRHMDILPSEESQ